VEVISLENLETAQRAAGRAKDLAALGAIRGLRKRHT